MPKICVYTCIVGEYDNLKEIEYIDENIDYILFTDKKNIKSNTWKVVYIENDENLPKVILARKIKILGHPSINNKYDVLMWIDGSVKFNTKMGKFLEQFLTDSDVFVGFKHGERKNIEEECYACVKMRKETKNNVINLLNFYKKQNYKFDNGLIESAVYIKRPKDKTVKETLNIWYNMVISYSKRDQLSFNYAIYKTGLKVKWINEKVFHNKWFKCYTHNYEKNIKSYRVYFDDNNNYSFDNDFQGDFLYKNGKYIINLNVPCDTKKIIIELSRVPFIEMTNLKINNFEKIDSHYFNAIVNDKNVFFYNENGAFEIYNFLKKGTKLKIVMNLNILDTEALMKVIEKQEKKHIQYILDTIDNQKKYQDEINKLKQENENLKNELDKILNSKTWKFINKILISRKEK